MIMNGALPPGSASRAAGVDLRWLQRRTLQLTDAPPWYSLRARVLGELCGSCDLGLPVSCACPPSEPMVARP